MTWRYPFSFICICLLLISGCSNPPNGQEARAFRRLGKEVKVQRMFDHLNRYHMFDSTGQKVGSMVFAWTKNGPHLIARDTSQFDNGSVYETASMFINSGSMIMDSIDLDLRLPHVQVGINLFSRAGNISGNFQVSRDTMVSNTPVDTTYQFDVFREELYALMPLLDFSPGDSIAFKMLLTTSRSVIDAALVYERSEEIQVAAGTFQTDVLYLNTGGVIDNRIWFSQDAPYQIVKFYVPGSDLSIDLLEVIETGNP